uniref:Uncharacterized protein n=1 Tax=Strigamia maritima TaxID=126957 RepID=T1IZS1_STRMM
MAWKMYSRRISFIFKTHCNSFPRFLRFYGVENTAISNHFNRDCAEKVCSIQTVIQMPNLDLVRPQTGLTSIDNEPDKKVKILLPRLKYRRIDEVLRQLNLKIVDDEMYKQVKGFIPGELEQRYYNCLDFGFKNISLDHLLRFCQIMKMKRFSVEFIRDPLESLVSQTEIPEALMEIILEKYPIVLDGNLKLLHRIVLLEYLKWKLEIENIKFLGLVNKYPAVSNKSISSLRETIDLLTNDLGFTTKKIVNNGYLLLINKENVAKLLSQKSNFGGIPANQFISKFPRTLSVHVDHIYEIDECLMEFGITQDHISTCGHIYTFKTTTLHERLKLLSETPEMNNLKNSHRYLYLVYYFNKVKHRLEIVKFIKLKNISIDLFLTSNELFIQKLDLEGFRQRKHQIVNYIAKRFGITTKLVFHRIDFDYFSGLTLDKEKMEESIEFLSNRFKKQEILDNLSVILFELDVIKEELTKVINKSKTKVNMLKDLKESFENSLKKLYMKPYKSDKATKFGRTVDIDSEENLLNKFLDS